jgi:hypothetical protein
MDRSPSAGSAPVPPDATPFRAILRDALQYWEPRRIGYNLALTVLASAVVLRTWPHFRPAMTPQSIPPLAVLAMLANLCYCAAYLAEALVGDSAFRETWRHRRWILWLAGTLLALLIEYYWIVDEIYPSVPYVR